MPFDVTKLDSQTIIFGGLTLIGLALIWLVFRMSKYYYNHTNDVIERNSSVINESARSAQRLADSHEKLADAIENMANRRRRYSDSRYRRKKK